MKKEIFNKKLIEFIEASTSSFNCVNEIRKVLLDNGYVELIESDKWNLVGNKFFIIRNDASIIAVEIPESASSFSIITTHCDIPALALKPNGAYIKENYLKYNVMPYGGLLNYGWLDHPLSISGRIIVKSEDILKKQIVDFKKPMMIIPSVAIHQMKEANSNLDLNMQNDLQPLISLSENKKTWEEILQKEIKGEIVDYDLFTYNPSKPILIGNNKELLVSPRIDNLTSVFSSLYSFLEANPKNIKVFGSFNSEETGSMSIDGADSNFLIDILKRLASQIDIDIASSLADSLIISSDNTHAIHPNHGEYADDTGIAYLSNGFAIIKEANSTTNALSSSIIKSICDKNNIKFQEVTCKNDAAGGSTLSGISLRHVSVLSVDVGVPQLSMHSSIETCCIDDVYELYKMMGAFYNSKIIRKDDKIKIN